MNGVLCLMGPTATGKTGLAIQLAAHFPIEIISVDSVLVYRGLDIGSAKPSLVERAGVPHHLIDCCDFWHPYSAAQFAQQAHALVQAIHRRGYLPLLVGGTALYFKAFLEGLSALPQAQPCLRAEIEAYGRQWGSAALHQQLQQQDPERARQLHPNDWQRLVRALEIVRSTGRPVQYMPHPLPAVMACVTALDPGERIELRRRIEARFVDMLQQGFEDEVAALMQLPRFSDQLPAFKAVGYRQMCCYLQGSLTAQEMRQQAIQATYQLAKRQSTWFRHWPGVQHIAAGVSDQPFTELRRCCQRLLHT